MTINEVIKGLNEHKMFFKKEGTAYLNIKDDEGKTHFLNTAVAVDVDGVRIQENGKDKFVWTLGSEMRPQETVVVPTQQTLPI